MQENRFHLRGTFKSQVPTPPPLRGEQVNGTTSVTYEAWITGDETISVADEPPLEGFTQGHAERLQRKWSAVGWLVEVKLQDPVEATPVEV